MMRFILDCLRVGRRRAACERENSVELQTKDKDAANDNEIKVLEDVVAMEAGTLQKERVLSQDAQQALERLTKRRTQLKEEIEGIQEQRKQEGQLLLSLQEEQEELEQMVQEYEVELERANDELQHLHEEVRKTRARVEDAHGRMGPLKHSIGETYTEITETKERLGELIAEMIAIEACVPEITCHQMAEHLSIDLDNSSREEEDDDDEECYGHAHEDENTIKKITVEKYHSEQEQNIEGSETLQRSAENLKSSGSSSFTEITLTEVKEEDVSPRSNTPQHMDSPDLEEDFEIVQSVDTKPINQTSSREFDFFHPDPFVDHDVFGDDRFPKVDMTEFLSGDPFKGTDPFASDILFNDVADAQFSQDYPHNEESNTNKDEHADAANAVIHSSANADCQSIDSGMFEQNIPEPSDSERYTPYSDVCPDVGSNNTVSQELDSMELNNTSGTEFDLPASSLHDDEGRFDPIHCELHDSHESDSSESSTVDSSFDGDFGTFTGLEQTEPEPEPDVGPSYVRSNRALYGLQRIDTSAYTSFPLSPDDFAPEQDVPVASDKDKPVEGADQFSFHSDHDDAVSEVKPEVEEALSPEGNPASPSPLDQEFDKPCDDYIQEIPAVHSPEPAEVDVYDHKFGDIYFFTVRLDPGSPDASPGSAEANEQKKSECDQTSPESNEADEFDSAAPEEEDTNHYNPEAYLEESFDKEDSSIRTEETLSPEPNDPEQSEPEVSPTGYSPNFEQEDEDNGLDEFGHSIFNVESSSVLKNTENEIPESFHPENVDSENEIPVKVDPAYTEDYSVHFTTEPVDQFLISPVSGDTEKAASNSSKLCSHNPFSLDSESIDHCDDAESNLQPFNTKNCTGKESYGCVNELKSFDPFDHVLIENTISVKSANSTCTDSGRLDSGYHENNGLDPFSPAPSHPSTDMGPCFVSSNTEMLSPGLLDLEAPDPFSPESIGSSSTMRFHSELFNPSTDDGMIGDPCQVYTASSDILGDSFSGSELDSLDPFSPVPHLTGGSYSHCNVDILVPGLIQNNSKFDGETRSSSCDSGVGSAQNREGSQPPIHSEVNNFVYLPNCPTKDSFFESDNSNMVTDDHAFQSKVENVSEQEQNTNSSANDTSMAELTEIDFFCNELSKMVASRSSDTVQQSVAEMLFGSNPDTASFYPWDFENSDTVANNYSSPEADLVDNSYNYSKDLPKLESGARSRRSSDLLGELQSAAGLAHDETEKPCLL
ncbi:dentin sialophosphoprotein isoform X1 [Astyanax mexicanus]|uniref:dentin sialophosphoprotein isoform X1 n=1 Tax=Astyanax mexicanus TaxID=7994 RepID=UPI0020CAAECD|nr:dentin sialophosphoprotein isoform X1 [Astyanax mexicanus]